MKIKRNKLIRIFAGMVLTVLLSVSSINMRVDASSGVCNGNHKFDIYVCDAGWRIKGDTHIHMHNDEYRCFYYDRVRIKLMRCGGCGEERVFEIDGTYEVHHVKAE